MTATVVAEDQALAIELATGTSQSSPAMPQILGDTHLRESGCCDRH